MPEKQYTKNRFGEYVLVDHRPVQYDDRDADQRSKSSIRTRTTTQRPVADVLYEEEDDEYETEPVARPVQRASRAPQRTVATQQPRQGGRPQQQMEYYPEDQPQPRPGRRPRRVTAEDAVILEGFADRAIDPRDRHATSDYSAPTERFTGPQMPAVVPDRPGAMQGLRNGIHNRRAFFGKAGKILGYGALGVMGTVGIGEAVIHEWQSANDQTNRQLAAGALPHDEKDFVCGHNNDSKQNPTIITAWIDKAGYANSIEYSDASTTQAHKFRSTLTLRDMGFHGDLSHVKLEIIVEPAGKGLFSVLYRVTCYEVFPSTLIPFAYEPMDFVLVDTGKGYYDQVQGSKGGAK